MGNGTDRIMRVVLWTLIAVWFIALAGVAYAILV